MCHLTKTNKTHHTDVRYPLNLKWVQQRRMSRKLISYIYTDNLHMEQNLDWVLQQMPPSFPQTDACHPLIIKAYSKLEIN